MHLLCSDVSASHKLFNPPYRQVLHFVLPLIMRLCRSQLQPQPHRAKCAKNFILSKRFLPIYVCIVIFIILLCLSVSQNTVLSLMVWKSEQGREFLLVEQTTQPTVSRSLPKYRSCCLHLTQWKEMGTAVYAEKHFPSSILVVQFKVSMRTSK